MTVRGLASALGLALLGALTPAAARAETFSWVQAVPGGWEARAITQDADCPGAEIGGQAAAMSVRAPPGEGYPILVCALALPPRVGSLSVAGQALKVPEAEVGRVLLIGDTGCRLNRFMAQACDDPAAWPFRAIAEAGTASGPDLVVHTGDYHYREAPCPAGKAGCAGSPSGDTWAVWREDFFSPARALLGAAPWVFTRGNHEICGRGGLGWTRLLDPRPFDPAQPCAGPAEMFTARLGGIDLAVMDVADIEDRFIQPEQVSRLRPQYQRLAGGGPTWLVQHRPIWSVVRVEAGRVVGGNETLARAARDALPGNVALMISGHLHVFQVLNFAAELPPQMIVGHGCTLLDQGTPADPAGLVIQEVTDGVGVASGLSRPGVFGFVLMERRAEGWSAANHDQQGTPLTRCRVASRRIICP